MIQAFAILLCFELLGELISHLLNLPIPAAVIGMMLLFLALLCFKGLHEKVVPASRHLLKNMSLFFIPAGVGIMLVWDKVCESFLPLLAVIVLGTWLTLLACTLSFDFFRSRGKK